MWSLWNFSSTLLSLSLCVPSSLLLCLHFCLCIFLCLLSLSFSLSLVTKITQICAYLFQSLLLLIHSHTSFFFVGLLLSIFVYLLALFPLLSSLSLTLSLQRLEFIRFWNVKWWTLKCPQFVKSPLHIVMNNFIYFCHV